MWRMSDVPYEMRIRVQSKIAQGPGDRHNYDELFFTKIVSPVAYVATINIDTRYRIVTRPRVYACISAFHRERYELKH